MILSHDVIIELSGASDVERESSDFAAEFALLGPAEVNSVMASPSSSS